MVRTMRVARPEDAAALSALDRRVVEDGRGVVRSLAQVTTVDAFRAQIEGHREPDAVFLVIEDALGQVIGDGSVRRMTAALGLHNAHLAIQIDPLAQGCGHGRALSEALVRWCDDAGVGRLSLAVRADNDRAIGLYRSLGFAQEVRRRGYLRMPDGRWVDDLAMVRWNRPVDAEKAAAAIVRHCGTQPEILVFDHPLAGWQLPKGTVEAGERPDQAVVREVEEETGLAGATVVEALGSWVQVGSDDGRTNDQRWHGFLIQPPPSTPDRWDHVCSGSPAEDGPILAFRWVGLDAVVDVLPPSFHELALRALASARRRSGAARPPVNPRGQG